MGAIVSSPPGASSTREVRVAVSSTGTRTSRWVSLHVHGTATAFAWVVPVKPSAFVDLTSDAWLESLEDATAPRIVPPDVSPPCGAGGAEVDGDLSHVVTTAPDSVATAADAATLGNTLAGWGITVTGDLAPLLDAAGADGDSFIALLYSSASPDVVTRTVRIVDTSSATIPLGLTSGSSTVAVTAYAFATGGVTLGTSPSLTLDPTLLLWQADGTSTYAPVSETLLTTNPGAWLVETTGHPELFAGEAVPGSGAAPALAPTYFSRAWTYGDASGAPSACSADADAVATSLSPVAIACPAGALARVGGASCVEGPVTSGEVDPGALRCGGIADDLALALSGISPASVWLTRTRSVVSAGAFGVDAALAPDTVGSEATGPVVTCSGYGQACGGGNSSGGAPPPTGGPSSSSGGAGASSGGGTTDPGGGSSVGSTVGNVVGAALDASSSTDDGCGGDSSDDSGDSCSGDGGGGDAASGDDCSGGSSPDCALGRPGGRHSPTSRILLLVVAFAAVARRRTRSEAVRLPGS